MAKNLLILQSGGPTSAINSTLAGVIHSAINSNDSCKVYGAINGVNGIIDKNMIDLSKMNNEEIMLLKNTPAAFLGSTRYVLPKEFINENNELVEDYNKILNNVKELDIKRICLIGGNDSMDTAAKLTKFFKSQNYDCNIIGIPKTIDNDLILTDHTPGYGSTAKYIATLISEIKLDTSVYDKGRVTIVEIMGRDAGWLTAASKLACLNDLGPDFIYLPECPFNMKKFLEDVKERYKKNKKVLICISEGIKNDSGKYVSEDYSYQGMMDVFGHKQLGGASSVLSDVVHEILNLPVRKIELNLPQRCDLVHASKTDLDESFELGLFAEKESNNLNGKFISINRIANESKEYKVEFKPVDIDKVANKVKYFPIEWISNGNDISNNFIDYCLPLIQGEPKITYKNGLPCFLKRKDTK